MPPPLARHRLPAVGTLLDDPEVRNLLARAPRTSVTKAVRTVIARVRAGEAPLPASPLLWSQLVAEELEQGELPSLRRVLNGTGVVLHTNLGRAPLAQVAIDAIADAASGASNLEYNLATGSRGSRDVHAVALLRELTGAEDALVVNNCAAALVLALNTVCDGREAIISRGELIEIGGSFRIPDIMTRSGARLHEVGTTNRTHVDDYRRALNAASGAIVKVHRANFEQQGYVAEAALRDLTAVAGEGGVSLVYDFGSGLMTDLSTFGLAGEPLARDGVLAGADLVVMSGDKLLGGPQAGIILGRATAVAACRRNPLARALRIDKLRIAALEATLRLYRDPATALRTIPVLAMLTSPPDAIHQRAVTLAAALQHAGIGCTVVATQATVGGGAFPLARIDSSGITLEAPAVAAEAALRLARLPLIGRIEHGRFVMDLRSLSPEEDVLAVDVMTRALR